MPVDSERRALSRRFREPGQLKNTAMAISRARDTPIRDNWKCILVCLAMAMANCQYGYDTATIAGFQGGPPSLPSLHR